MTTLMKAGGGSGAITPAEYQPGVCNIGPAEIRRRRRVGHVGLAGSVGLLAMLLMADAPPITRLLVAGPAALGASGYLQAALKFCAGYGSRGVLNFGEAGRWTAVGDPEAAAADLRMARRIGLGSLAIGSIAALLTLLLPR